MECPICLDEFQRDDDVYTIKSCGHSFHKKCIHKWFCKSNTCPYCREKVENIFYVKTKNIINRPKKVILEVTNLLINFFDENFDKKIDYFELSHLTNMIILNNALELRYIKNNKEKKKKIYFVNQAYCIYFYRYMYYSYQLHARVMYNNYL